MKMWSTFILICLFDGVFCDGEFFLGDIKIRKRVGTMERMATTRKAVRWPNGIVPYILDEIYSESEKNLIRSGMDEFEKKTCIRFVERTNEEYYIEILVEMGCWSELGKVGGVQSLSLESPNCMSKGVVLHELMHALGFLHEQSRTDRDDYVEVNWDNIVEGMAPNFEKLSPIEIDSLGLDYDYSSVTHYGSSFFAMNRSVPVLTPTNNQVPIEELGSGIRNGILTDLDVQKINKFYECPGRSECPAPVRCECPAPVPCFTTKIPKERDFL